LRTLLLLVIFLASFLVGSGLIGWLTQDIPRLPPLIRVFLNIITLVFLLVSIGYYSNPRRFVIFHTSQTLLIAG